MNSYKKAFSLSATVLGLSLLVAGCGSDATEEKEVATNEKVQIEMWLTPQWKGVQSASEEN